MPHFGCHLTARCAGFLETSQYEDQGKPRPTSCVTFLHRTARDFLENKERWAKLLAPTLTLSFEPVYALAKGCSLCVVLSWHLYGEEQNYTVTKEMWLMARDALAYFYEVSLRDLPLGNCPRSSKKWAM